MTLDINGSLSKNKINRGVAGAHETSKIELFGKIVISLKAVNCVRKNLPSSMLDGFKLRLC